MILPEIPEAILKSETAAVALLMGGCMTLTYVPFDAMAPCMKISEALENDGILRLTSLQPCRKSKAEESVAPEVTSISKYFTTCLSAMLSPHCKQGKDVTGYKPRSTDSPSNGGTASTGIGD